MHLPLFLARRLYGNSSHEGQHRATSLAIRIATVGVAVGLMVMIVSICVVKGFQREVRQKVAGFTSHIEILDRNTFSSPESYPITADAALIDAARRTPHVQRVQTTSLKMGIIKTQDAFQTIVLKGIGTDYDTAFIHTQLLEGRLPHLTATDNSNEVIVSREQAQKLGLKVGSKVFTYFISDDIRLRRFTVVGVYETNLQQFDNYFVWTDLQTVNRLNRWEQNQCSALEVYLDDFSSIDQTQIALARLTNGRTDAHGAAYSTISIKENPRTSSVVQWLTLLDTNVWVILILMLGVAGFTVISGLLILILERTQTIGILKALGATSTRIRHTFMLYASMIVIRGLLFGNVFALALVFAQRAFGLVHLDPATYYVSAVPVEINVWWILALNVATLVLCMLAMIVPSFIISHIRPAKAIRFE